MLLDPPLSAGVRGVTQAPHPYVGVNADVSGGSPATRKG
jgi:hypothetical protein